MESEESVPTLVDCLCELNVKQSLRHQRATGVCLHEQRRTMKRKLKVKAFDTIFGFLNDRCRNRKVTIGQKEEVTLSARERLFARLFYLRRQRKFDDAKKLQDLIGRLCQSEVSDTVNHVLEFLLCLEDSVKKSECNVLGHTSEFGHKMNTGHTVQSLCIPHGILVYGDTKYDLPDVTHYTHYPRELFERPFDPFLGFGDCLLLRPQIFTVEPGSLAPAFFHTVRSTNDDVYLREAQTSLFGALVQSRVMTLNAKLDIPDLTEPCNFHFPDFRKSRLMQSTDDGFISSNSTTPATPDLSVTAETSCDEFPEEENIWMVALHHKLDKHFTWETRGRGSKRLRERPFLTEAGTRAFDEMRNLYLANRLMMVDATVPRLVESCVTLPELVVDILKLLLAVPSRCFIWQQDEFHVLEGLFVSGISPDTLRHQCGIFLRCGTDFRRLSDFSRARQPNSFDEFGVVMEAFRAGVRCYLQHYRACILSVAAAEMTPMKITVVLRKVIEQLIYVATLCCLDDVSRQDGEQSLPTGSRLLSLLYNEALLASSSLHYPLLLSLLRTTAAPYLCMVHDWVFHGRCRDEFAEFMLQVNQEYIGRRDEQYWTRTYTPTADNAANAVPTFLSDIAEDVFICGKSLNLLKLCSKGQHFLSGSVSGVDAPLLKLVLSKHDLASMQHQFASYFSRMLAVTKQRMRTRTEMKLKAEQEKHDTLIRARHAAADRLHKLQGKVLELKKKEDLHKRKLFAELKQQMEQEVEQKEALREQEREADKAFIDSANKQEILETMHNAEIERQAREELIAHYAKLGEEAVSREQRALWRIQRHKLDEQRYQFLMQQQSLFDSPDGAAVELLPSEAQTSSQSLDISLLPLWARKAVENEASTIASDSQLTSGSDGSGSFPGRKWHPESRLPSWAARGLAGELPSVVEETESQEDLLTSERKLVPGFSVDAESVETEEHVHKKMVPGYSVSAESISADEHMQTKMVPGFSVSAESIETVDGIHKKMVAGQSINAETVSSDERLQTKMVPGFGINVESSSSEPRAQTKMVPSCQIGQESTEAKQRKQTKSVAGKHISNESDDILLQAATSQDSERKNLIEDSAVCEELKENVMEMVAGESAVTSGQELESGDGLPLESVCGLEHRPGVDLVNPDAVLGNIQTKESPRIQQAPSHCVSDESEAPEGRLSTRTVADRNANKESFEVPEIRHLKLVSGHRVTDESTGTAENQRSHVRVSATSNALTETEEKDPRMRRKIVAGHNIGDETTEMESRLRPHIKMHPERCSTVESSGDFQERNGIPRLKRRADMDASRESDWSDFTSYQVRRSFVPRRRKVAGQSVDTESARDTPDVPRSHIHMNKSMNAMTESQFVDVDLNRKHRFLEQNIHGHASDSSIQLLMYGDRGSELVADGSGIEIDSIRPVILESSPWADQGVEPYRDNFDCLDNSPAVNLMANQQFVDLDAVQQQTSDSSPDDDTDGRIETLDVISLPVLIHRYILAPIHAQVALVNDTIVNYFMVEMNLDGHFTALRRYVLMHDGEFAQSLTDQLFNMLDSPRQVNEFLNPIYLNNVLQKAVASSLNCDSSYAQNIGFLVRRRLPKTVSKNSAEVLDCLQMTYKVDFPGNLVITDSCVNKYSQIFTFMLQLKRATWVLTDVFHRLKRDSQANGSRFEGQQMRAVQQYRSEMQHFIRVLHEYVANQVISVSWQEFQLDLEDQLNGLDDLHRRHLNYINKCLYRCLLNQKAAPVLKIVRSIFGLILTFSSQLATECWQIDPTSRQLRHPSFDYLQRTYTAFHQHSLFLFKVIQQMTVRSFQPHLEEILLRINFNGFYQPI